MARITFASSAEYQIQMGLMDDDLDIIKRAVKARKAVLAEKNKPEPWFPETTGVAAFYCAEVDRNGVLCVEAIDPEYMDTLEDVAESALFYPGVIYFYVPKGGA